MIRHHVDLQRANTLGLPCRAERFVAADSLTVARDALRQAADNGWPLTVLGGGSNLILQPFLPGLTLQPVFNGVRFEPLDQGEVRVQVEAGMSWHDLVVCVAERGLWGTENLALIPGNAGAAPIQNIGAYGVELADVLERVHLLHLDDGRECILERDECRFGYRDSIFKHELEDRVVVTRLVLRVSSRARPRLEYGDLGQRVGTSPSPGEVVAAVSAIRREKLPDPAETGNAGSFFKNPSVPAAQARELLEQFPEMPHFPQREGRVKLAAGWLIDQCGLKGLRSGHVGVHERQALVLVHYGGGSAGELLALAEQVAATVRARFGVSLEREPRLVGRPRP
ncbi:MAG: UDP-N-acetylmuramate dehydrogenase [Halomonas sp.]|nr:UDP-N-acetylmuramate dehydrogenase [Halomonas sp.]